MRLTLKAAAATSGAAFVAAMLIACGGNPSPNPTPTSPAVTTAPTTAPTAQPTTAPTRRPSSPPADGAEQANATRAAQEYLTDQHFSRTGLIKQLKFEGYPTKAATTAVDSLHMDWNEQAALVARDYLQSQAFSKKSLTSQLEFDGFTSTQAQYGVAHSGL